MGWLVLIAMGLIGLAAKGSAKAPDVGTATIDPDAIEPPGGWLRSRPAAQRQRQFRAYEPEPIPSDPTNWVAGARCVAGPGIVYNGLTCRDGRWAPFFEGNDAPAALLGTATKDAAGVWVFANPYSHKWEAWGKSKDCDPELEHHTVTGYWDRQIPDGPRRGELEQSGPHTRVCREGSSSDTKWMDPDDFSSCAGKATAVAFAPFLAATEVGYELHHGYCTPYFGPDHAGSIPDEYRA